MRATRVRTLAQSFGSAPLCETLKQWLRGYTARTHLRVHAYSFFFFSSSSPFSSPTFLFTQPLPVILPLTPTYLFPSPVLLPLLASPTAFTVLLYALYPRFTILDDNSFRPTLFSFHTLARIYCLPRSSLSLSFPFLFSKTMDTPFNFPKEEFSEFEEIVPISIFKNYHDRGGGLGSPRNRLVKIADLI